MLLLQLTALAVSFRTCFRKVIIPAMGQKRENSQTTSHGHSKNPKKKYRTNISKKQLCAYQFVLQRSNKFKMLLPLLIFFPPLVIDPWMECLCGLLLLSRTNHTNQPHIIVSFVITFCSLSTA